MNKIIATLIFLTVFTDNVYAADISFFLNCSPDCTNTVIKSTAPKKEDSNKNVNEPSDFVKSIAGSSGPSTLDMRNQTPSGSVDPLTPKKEIIKQHPKYKGENGTDNIDVSGGWNENINNEDGKWKADEHKDENTLVNSPKIKIEDNSNIEKEGHPKLIATESDNIKNN
jgi:hypothetical protein